MATFKKDDWVQITPKPDTRWSNWDIEIHNYFCNKIGYIEAVEKDAEKYDDPEMDMIRVAVYFSDDTFNKPGWFFAYFLKKHLVLTTSAHHSRYVNDEDAAKLTNDFEETVRKKRDEIFRHMFEPEKQEKSVIVKKENKKEKKDIDLMDLQNLTDEDFLDAITALDPFI